jgi:hypothetical protein
MVESKSKAKSFVFLKEVVWEAWKQVRANQGAAGVDEESIQDFERNLSRGTSTRPGTGCPRGRICRRR